MITKDLLGGCCTTNTLGSRELELDSQVPYGWEKHLDLESGNVYLRKCNSPTMLSDHNSQIKGTKSLHLFDEMSLDLKLFSSSSMSPSSSPSMENYQNVCTLDKVKSALERADCREKMKKRSPQNSDSYSTSSTRDIKADCDENSSPLSFATGCPNCLLYVMIPVTNPRCPRCNTVISLPSAMKKPRIDLNISI